MLPQNALEKLAARKRLKDSGVASLKIRCAKGLRRKVKTCDIAITSTGEELLEKVEKC